MNRPKDFSGGAFPARRRRRTMPGWLSVRPLALAAAGVAVFAFSGSPATAQTSTMEDGSVVVDLGILRQLLVPPGTGASLPGAGGRVLLMPGTNQPRSQLHVPAPGGGIVLKAPPLKAESRLTLAQPEPAASPSPPPAPAPPAVPRGESPEVVELPPPPPEIKPPAKEPVMAKAEPEPQPEPQPAPEPTPVVIEEAAPPPPPPVAEETPPPAPPTVVEEAPPPPPETAAVPEPPAPPTVAEEAPPPPPETAAVPAPTVAEEAPPPPPEPPAVQQAEPEPPQPAEEPAPTEQAALTPPAQALEVGHAMQVVFEDTNAKLPASARAELIALAEQLKAQKDFRLQLQAFASDESLSAGKARRLSLSRALTVRSFLIENGIRSTRIDVRALGNKTTKQPVNRVDVNVVQR